MRAILIDKVAELRAYLDAARAKGQKVAAVPTMGALHDGHLALVREAKRRGEVVVVTIFVNPTQFGPGEDFEKYPRDLNRDMEAAASAGATCVFAPPVSEMYPESEQTRVHVSGVDQGMCGAGRPGHFEGVATVVAKLFNVVGSASYVFGRKDFQQLRVIQRMAIDLLFPVEVVEHPTVRQADGLALSSRNAYLSKDERHAALAIPRSLVAANRAFSAGERSVSILRETVRGALDRAGLKVEYVELARPDTLSYYVDDETLPGPTLLALAARSGSTRLIDNLVLGQDPSPDVQGAEERV